MCDGCPGSVLAWLWRTVRCGNLSLSDFYVENVFEELDAPAEVRCRLMGWNEWARGHGNNFF